MTAAAPLVRALVESVERTGIPRATYLSAARVDEERLADETSRFELEELDRLYTLALDLTGDEALGLHLVERSSEAAFDVVGHLVTHAPTLRESFALVSRFGPLISTDGVISLSEKVDVARISARVAPMSARSYRFHMDFTMAGMLRLIRFFVSSLAPVNAVYFEHRPPVNRHEYTRLFGGNESFGHDVTAIEFPRMWLDRRALHRSDRLFTMLLGEARRHLDSLENGASYGDRVERYLHSFPPSRVPGMEVAARDLGTSVRSLRRYLAAEGTSYRAFVKRALERAAVEMLRNPQRSVEEIALSAGYAEAPAFNRAFKRWTGLTPSEFRRTTSP